MKESPAHLSLGHIAGLCIAFAGVLGLIARQTHHRDLPPISGATDVAIPTATQAVAAQEHRGPAQVIADCQPHLRAPPLSVPNIEVTDRFNMAAVRLTVRFFVNSDGFVTRAFVTGFTVTTAADQEAELDFVQHLTFTVPQTAECRSRELEMIGNFTESRESGGAWATVFDVSPRYSSEGGRIVQKR
jgi:hypothetical protein